MQQSLPSIPSPKPENKCPECLFIDLQGILVQSDGIDLNLTINFNEQWEALKGGRVKFGLKGGELRLKLENSKSPYEFRKFTRLLTVELIMGRDTTGSYKTTGSAGLSVEKEKAGVSTNFSAEEQYGATDKFQFTTCQVTTKGSEENPIWDFRVKTGEPVLIGSLTNSKLATLSVTKKPCCVEATFEISKRDVYISEGEGLYPDNISRNKRAWIEREIALWLLETKLNPYMSRVRLQYD